MFQADAPPPRRTSISSRLGPLIPGLRAGNEAAWAKLVENAGSRLERQAKRDAPNHVSTALQETWLRLYKSIPRLRAQNGRGLMAWLLRTLKNVCADFGRPARVRRGEVPVDENRDADTKPTPASAAAQSEELANLREQLELLPHDRAEVIRLRYLECLPFEEVARRMGRTVNAVKNLCRRGEAQLRQGPG